MVRMGLPRFSGKLRPLAVSARPNSAKDSPLIAPKSEICAGVVTVSRRLGHESLAAALTAYAHLFEKTGLVAAPAIEATLKAGTQDK